MSTNFSSGQNHCSVKRIYAVLALTLFILTTPIHAMPPLIDFQGKLADSNNVPQTGVFNITFSMFNQSTGGTLLWKENKLVSASNGLFSTFLGSVNAINLSFNADYFVEINISGETVMPRYRVATVPYAFRANISEYAIARDIGHVATDL